MVKKIRQNLPGGEGKKKSELNGQAGWLPNREFEVVVLHIIEATSEKIELDLYCLHCLQRSPLSALALIHSIENSCDYLTLDLTKQQAHQSDTKSSPHTSSQVDAGKKQLMCTISLSMQRRRKGSMSLNPPVHHCRKQNSH
jgi:hypothetical protein